MKKLIFISLAAMFSLGAITACSDDTENPQGINCAKDELYNPHTEVCVKANPDTENDTGVIPTDDTDLDDPDVSDNDTPEITDDAGEQPDTPDTPDPVDPACDKDEDGHLAYECGGMDCDDNDPARHPSAFEICNGIDDNCNGVADEFLECTFYAHTVDALYKINPFEGTFDKQSELVDSKGAEIVLNDIDTHPSGTLYGVGYITFQSTINSGLYIFDTTENFWVKAASINVAKYANGLAIDFDGVGYITVDNQLFKLDLTNTERLLLEKGLKDNTFSKQTISLEPLNITPDYFISSGDSVVNKQNTLFMTSKHDKAQDYLVEINRDTAAAVSIGPIGFDKIYGLTAAWNNLYGTTREGELITIDTQTGAGKLIKAFPGKSWYGAASSPNR